MKRMLHAALGGLLAMALAGPSMAAGSDWAQLEKYRAANAGLAMPRPGEARVVFMGDSITEFWDVRRESMFADPRYVNRGISGQTTPQMLVRFRADVLALRPRLVVLLAGTNDIAGNTGEATVDEIAGHLRSMVQLARSEGIGVILCAVLPAARYYWKPEIEPVPRIAALNGRLKAMASEFGVGWVDYFEAMNDGQGGLPTRYSGDGVHPNEAGYARMRELLEPAIAAQLRPAAR